MIEIIEEKQKEIKQRRKNTSSTDLSGVGVGQKITKQGSMKEVRFENLEKSNNHELRFIDDQSSKGATEKQRRSLRNRISQSSNWSSQKKHIHIVFRDEELK